MIKSIAVATAATLAVIGAGVALATTNVYETTASFTSSKNATLAKPIPVGLKNAFTTKEAAGQRPATVSHFEYAYDGIRSNGKYFPVCAAARINDAGSDSSCPKGSQVGSGTASATTGVTADPNDQTFHCALVTKEYNAPKDHMAIYLRSDPATCNGITVNKAIDAKFVGGRTGKAKLVYDVPAELNHSVGGTSSATVSSKLTIPRRTVTVKGRKVGFLEAVGGCKAGKRKVTLGFTTEDGAKGTATAKGAC